MEVHNNMSLYELQSKKKRNVLLTQKGNIKKAVPLKTKSIDIANQVSRFAEITKYSDETPFVPFSSTLCEPSQGDTPLDFPEEETEAMEMSWIAKEESKESPEEPPSGLTPEEKERIDYFALIIDKVKGCFLSSQLKRKEIIEQYKEFYDSIEKYKMTPSYSKLKERAEQEKAEFQKQPGAPPLTLIIGLEDLLMCVSPSEPLKYDAEIAIGDEFVDLGSVFVSVRPYLFEFLEYITQLYEVIVFCNGSSIYCAPLLDFLERERKYFAHRIYNTHALFENPKYSVKFYDFLFYSGRSVSNTIIVDTHVAAFSLSLFSGVTVTSFKTAKDSDTELIFLGSFLKALSTTDNIYMKIRSTIQKTLFCSF